MLNLPLMKWVIWNRWNRLCYFLHCESLFHCQKGRNIVYADYFILGQIILAAVLPYDVLVYECGSEKLKIIRPIYEVETGEFKGLQETFGLISIREHAEETFLITVFMGKI